MSERKKPFFNRAPEGESQLKKMQIALGMAGIFPPIRSNTDFTPPKIRNSVQEAAIAEQMARDDDMDGTILPDEEPEFRRKGDAPSKFEIDADQVTYPVED